ncbi:putative ribonuclease H-like domain-containing protein [Senna tora]|uniref:Putative ribonuclease H-like domain-containing protein n=1 Tax=Senna tora TaxID=362788 RepID=A0A834W183_9FABA|nr:putative ribonuclease H-like domain-containing protein [Senna tora]
MCHHYFGRSVLKDEAWGVVEGIKIALQIGFNRVLIESDSKCLADGINSSALHGSDVQALFCKIRLLMSRFAHCKIQHQWRQGNMAADFLASMGSNSEDRRTELDCPPVGIRNLLYADVVAIPLPRVVTSSYIEEKIDRKESSSVAKWKPPPQDVFKLNVDAATELRWSRGAIAVVNQIVSKWCAALIPALFLGNLQVYLKSATPLSGAGFDHVEVRWINRCANGVADCVAKLALSHMLPLYWIGTLL